MLKYLWTHHKFATIATVVVVLIIIWALLYISFVPTHNTVNSHKDYYSSAKSSSSSSSGKVTGSGAGGYDMPKEGESFSEYVKRVDPELYGSLFKGLYD